MSSYDDPDSENYEMGSWGVVPSREEMREAAEQNRRDQRLAKLEAVLSCVRAFRVANTAFLRAMVAGADTGVLVDEQNETISALWKSLAAIDGPAPRVR